MMRRLTVSALIVAVLLTGCDFATVGQTAQTVTTYVGKAANSAAFVAVAVLGDKVWVYACDGQTIGQWFDGSIAAGAINLAEGSAQAIATVTNGVASGTVKLANATLDFTADVTKGAAAGLYRAEKTVGTATLVAGLIVLNDGEFRGLVTGGDSSVPISGPIPTDHGDTINLSNIGYIGDLTLNRAVPGSDEEPDNTATPAARLLVPPREMVFQAVVRFRDA